jgi:hypothetical protein
VDQEYTKSVPFYEPGCPAGTRPIAGAGTIAPPNASATTRLRSNAHKLLEKEVIFQSLYPVAAVAAGYGPPKGAGKFLKSSVFQKQADLAAKSLSLLPCPTAARSRVAPVRGYDFNARRWAVWTT